MKPVTKISIGAIVLLLAVSSVVGGLYFYSILEKTKSDNPAVWEDDIAAFEKQDREYRPPSGAILFVGSSSIRFWKSLEEDMAPLPVINRGFGGSKIPALFHYMKRIVKPYKPRMVVVYSGDNDMSIGRIQSPEEVSANLAAFAEQLHRDLPETTIYVLSIKPSPARIEFWPAMQRANELIRRFADGKSFIRFVDVSTPLLDGAGNPRREFFVFDRIHMNAQGYRIWTSILKPVLLEEYRKKDAEGARSGLRVHFTPLDHALTAHLFAFGNVPNPHLEKHGGAEKSPTRTLSLLPSY
jgi:lysophospholipase L1-like esterase